MQNLISSSDLIHNNFTRIPMCICIEKSIYTKNRLSIINKSIKTLESIIESKEHLNASADICVIVFSDKVELLKSFNGARKPLENVFSDAKNISDPVLLSALEESIKQLKIRRREYKSTQVSSYRPTLIVISSGRTSQNLSRIIEPLKSLTVYPIIIGNDNNGITNLRSIGDDGVIYNGTNDLDKKFISLGTSMENMSTSTRDVIDNLDRCRVDWSEYK